MSQPLILSLSKDSSLCKNQPNPKCPKMSGKKISLPHRPVIPAQAGTHKRLTTKWENGDPRRSRAGGNRPERAENEKPGKMEMSGFFPPRHSPVVP